MRSSAKEDIHGNDRVAVLSDHLWRKQFDADPNIVGKFVSIDGAQHLVAGVMPASFVYPAEQVDLWLPLAQMTDDEIPHMRQLRWIDAVGRLRPGISKTQALSSASLIMQRLETQYRETNEGLTAAAVLDLRESITGDVRPVLVALLVAVALVLLMACVNLANLLMARDNTRGREFAIRASLGAGKATLRRQSLTETMLLAVLGGTASFVVARLLTSVLLAMSAESVPRSAEVRPDGWVLGFGMVLSVLAGLLIGAIPAMRAAAPKIMESLKASGTSTATAGAQHQRARNALVVSEIAVACVLLTVTSLVLRSLWKLVNTNPGFRADHVLSVQLPLPLFKFQAGVPDNTASYRSELLRRVGALPGVVAVGGSKTMPLYGGGEPYGFNVVNRNGQQLHVTPTAGTYIVTQGYFEALSIPLVSGRVFTARDLDDRKKVVVVNQSLARAFFPGEDAAGKTLNMGETKLEIIGVVGDVRNEGLNKPSGTAVYIPSSMAPRQKLDLFIRTAGDPLMMANQVRQVIHDFEADQAITDIAPLAQSMNATVAQPKFFTTVLSGFGMVALLLAALGIFGVISYSVRERTKEIGIRLALGAERGDVLRLVLRQAALLLALALAIGLSASLLSARLIGKLLYGVSAADPAALAASVGVLTLVALGAAAIPARRAASVDPMIALRYE